jgi:hypothetical protein
MIFRPDATFNPHHWRNLRSYKGYNSLMRATVAPDGGSYSYGGTDYVASDDTMNVAQWFDYAPYPFSLDRL